MPRAYPRAARIPIPRRTSVPRVDRQPHHGQAPRQSESARPVEPNLPKLQAHILDLLKANPGGLNIAEIRARLPGIEGQQHLDKRVRELRAHYDVPCERGVYKYRGERTAPVGDEGKIPAKLRAEVLHHARGRCEMCGRTVGDDDIKLQLDHKVPRNWGGLTTRENLWALCQLCNGGKRDYFSSFDDDDMRRILALRSVHERLAETLRLHLGKPTPSWLLEFVANADDWQQDWQKRVRELRYPGIGLSIKASRRKSATGRSEAAYTLAEWKPLPPDFVKKMKKHEKETKRRNAEKAQDAMAKVTRR